MKDKVSGVVQTQITAIERGEMRKHEMQDNGTSFIDAGFHVLEFVENKVTSCRLEFDDSSLMMRRQNADYTHEFTFYRDISVTGFLKYSFGEIEASGKTHNYGFEINEDGEVTIDLAYELDIQGEVTRYEVKFEFTPKR